MSKYAGGTPAVPGSPHSIKKERHRPLLNAQFMPGLEGDSQSKEDIPWRSIPIGRCNPTEVRAVESLIGERELRVIESIQERRMEIYRRPLRDLGSLDDVEIDL